MNKFFELAGKVVVITLIIIVCLGVYAKYFDNKAYVEKECQIGNPKCEQLKKEYNIN